MFNKLLEVLKEFDSVVSPKYKELVKEGYSVESEEGNKVRHLLREQGVKLYKELSDLGFVLKEQTPYMKKYHETGIISGDDLIYIKMDDCAVLRNYGDKGVVDVKIGKEFRNSYNNAVFRHSKHWLTVYIKKGNQKMKIEYSDRGISRSSYARLPNGKLEQLKEINSRHNFKEDYNVGVNERDVIKDLVMLFKKSNKIQLRAVAKTYFNFNIKDSDVVFKIKLDGDSLTIKTSDIKVGLKEFSKVIDAKLNSHDSYDSEEYYMNYDKVSGDDLLIKELKDFNSVVSQDLYGGFKLNLIRNGLLWGEDNKFNFNFPKGKNLAVINYELGIDKLSVYRKDKDIYKKLLLEIYNLIKEGTKVRKYKLIITEIEDGSKDVYESEEFGSEEDMLEFLEEQGFDYNESKGFYEAMQVGIYFKAEVK